MAARLSIESSDLRSRTAKQTSEEKLRLLPPPISKLDGHEDLLLDILTRALTDPGSAARSRSVCKNWNSLLSKPYFFRHFIEHQQQRHVGDVTQLRESILSFIFPMSEDTRARFQVLDRSKDLTLCGFRHQSSFFLLVCNHYTKQLVALPPPLADLPAAFEDRAWWPSYCFLVCNPRNEHQFRVLFVSPRDRALQIFCSESKKWMDCKVDALYSSREMTVWNGKLYWMNSYPERVVQYDPFDDCKSSPRIAVVTFDADTTTLLDKRHILVPLFILSVSRGDLHAVRLLASGSLNVWRLDEDSKEWKMLYQVYTKTLTWCNDKEEEDEPLLLDNVLCQHPENPEVVFLKYLSRHGSVAVACNLQTRTLQRVNNRWSQPIFAWPTLVHNYNKLQGGCNDSSGS